MIQVQRGKNAMTTEYVIREMQTMAATCPARHAGQGSALKTEAVASSFWCTPGLPRVDACAAGRRPGASKGTRCVATRGRGLRRCYRDSYLGSNARSLLDPMIRRWADDYQHVAAKRTFNKAI